MRKINLFILVIIFFLIISSVLGDGIILSPVDKYSVAWHLEKEEKQFCAINYNDGIQYMILSIYSPSEFNSSRRGLWLFPVPANPKDVVIHILDEFPKFYGQDINDNIGMSESFKDMNRYLFFNVFNLFYSVKVSPSDMVLISGIEHSFSDIYVKEKIQKYGVTTELISTKNESSLFKYINSKGLKFPKSIIPVIKEYIGKNYSFVLSWVSDKNATLNNNLNHKHYTPDYLSDQKIISVFVSFPTKKIYYPLRLTSVYGSNKIPTEIYVLGFVKPLIYKKIKPYINVTYYDGSCSIQKTNKDFFIGLENTYSDYRDITYYGVYTDISLNSPSKLLVQDLWIEPKSPLKVRIKYLIYKYKFVLIILFFFLISMLSSLLSAIIVFKNLNTNKIKYFLFGLFNFLGLFSFGIATFFLRTKNKDEIKNIKNKFLNNQIDFDYYTIKNNKLLIFLLFLLFFISFLNLFYYEFYFLIFLILNFILIFLIIFYLSTLKIKNNSVKLDNSIFIKLFDIKRFIFLFLFNLIFSLIFITVSYFLIDNYLYPNFYFIYEDSIFPYSLLIVFIVFLLSIFILPYFDLINKSKKKIHLIDYRKLIFVVLFFIFFLILNEIFRIIFNLFIILIK